MKVPWITPVRLPLPNTPPSYLARAKPIVKLCLTAVLNKHTSRYVQFHANSIHAAVHTASQEISQLYAYSSVG